MHLRSGLWLSSLSLLALLLASCFYDPVFPPVVSAAPEKPVNLKVLPKETSLQDVQTRMAEMKRDLGVECGFCHDQNPDTKRTDFASDANPVKDTARAMMRMTQDIHDKYLSLLGDRRYASPITCGNCHLGQAHPPVFEGKEAR